MEEDAEGDRVLSPEAGVLDALAAEEWVMLSVGEGPEQGVLVVGGVGLTCCPVRHVRSQRGGHLSRVNGPLPARFPFRQGRVVVPSCQFA